MNKTYWSLAAAAIALATPAYAQTESSEPRAVETEVITVTAQRRETDLQETPVAVTAISGETLEERGATSLLDVQNFTPGLSVGSRSTAGSSRGGFTIRGIGVDSTDGSAGVGIYVDDVYLPSQAGNLLGLFDVQRIEVLRGPQGTLFGRNTIGGAVQYITTTPGDEFGGFLTGTYGNNDREEIGGALDLPISDTFAVRIAGRYNQNGGYVRDELNDIDLGEETTQQGRIRAVWTPTTDLTIDLKAEMLSQEGNGRAFALTAFNTASPGPGCIPFDPGGPGPCLADPNVAVLVGLGTYFGFDPTQLTSITTTPPGGYSIQGLNARDDFTFDYSSLQANVSWDLSDNLTVRSITALTTSEDEAFVDIDLSALPIFALNRGRTDTELFTQELQLSGDAFSDRLNYTFGVFYYHQDSNTDRRWQFPGISPVILPVVSDFNITTTAWAAFGQMSYALTDRLTATVGIRYSEEEFEASYLNTLIPNVGAPTVIPSPLYPPFTQSYDDVSPSFGLDFAATEDAFFYVKASRGFRAGGTALADGITTPPPPGQPGYFPFDQETAWTYEAGARLEFLDGRLRVNPTIFQTNWEAIQFNSILFLPSGPVVVTRNAGDAEIRGFELETQAFVTDQFSVYLALSTLDAEYTSVQAGAPVTTASELQRTPELKYGIGGQYTWPLANGGEFIANLDYAWNDDQRSATSDFDQIPIEAYGLLNGRLTYRAGNGLSVALYGTNLTDEYYYIGGTNGFFTFGGIEADLGRPREYGVTVRFEY